MLECWNVGRGLLGRRAGNDRRALTLTPARILPVHVHGNGRGGCGDYWWAVVAEVGSGQRQLPVNQHGR